MKMNYLPENKIYKMDVMEFLPRLEDSSVDLAIIDPPYNLKKGDWDNFKSENEFFEWTKNYLSLLSPKLKATASLYIFNTAYNSAFILKILLDLGLHYQNWIVWYKKDGFSACKNKFVNNQETILYFTKSAKNWTFNSNDVRVPYISKERLEAAKEKGILKNGKRWFPNENGKLCSDVWEFTSVRLTNKVDGKTKKQLHPTPKPEEMIERMILASSNKNDLVLDLFSGTGTTAFCAKKFGRNFIGCENNDEYIKVIEARLDELKAKIA